MGLENIHSTSVDVDCLGDTFDNSFIDDGWLANKGGREL
jgi:hypothetical protein